ncbi:MAG: DUF4493 domain-containing protein [Bacteroidaceae bacterium]|nr:DUF4493 domain-containing protein [Bacteroidaceae bacterium]
MKKSKHSLITLLYAGVMVLASCANEVDPFASSGQKTGDGMGTLEISLEGNVATRATTKVSTEEAKKFLITIFKGVSEVVKGPVPLDELGTNPSLSAGYGYSIMAESCSESDAENTEDDNHVKWGKRRYVGRSQSFAIIAGETTKVSVPCKVANGGVSAYFDPTITGHFTDYSITIKTDENQPRENLVFNASNCDYKDGDDIKQRQIAYFNIPTEGRTVKYSVTVGSITKEFVQTLEVAKIKRIAVSYKSGTFSLEINVEDEEMYMEDNVTIAPDPSIHDNVPVVTTQNVYENGELVGTTLSATDPSYDVDATEWSAVVKNASGDIVRTLSSAKGTLTSGAGDEDWPYLPMGNYVLEYTFENFKGIVETKQTTFNITEQPNFQVTLNALTSYSYAIGDGTTKNIAQANDCANNKIYAPTVTVTGISDALLVAKYGLSITYNNETKNNTKQAVYSDLTKDPGAYTLSATATFAGYSKNASKTVYITGIPYEANPPSTGNGWSNPNGSVNWNSDHVRLGTGVAGEQRIRKSFNVPADVNVAAYVKADTHGSVVGTTFTFYVAGESKHVASVSGTGDKASDTTVYGTLKPTNNTVECLNSYGMGLTHTSVYKVTVKYN